MDPITLYGAAAVSSMLAFYALEARARAFVLLFAAACAASSSYGFLAGTWPFGVIEAVWALVALRRWSQRRDVRDAPDAQPGALEARMHEAMR